MGGAAGAEGSLFARGFVVRGGGMCAACESVGGFAICVVLVLVGARGEESRWLGEERVLCGLWRGEVRVDFDD